MATLLSEAARMAGMAALLGAIGYGPAAWLAAGRHARRDALLLAPALGLAALGVVLHPLVLAGLPVARTWRPATAALLVASVLLARSGRRLAPSAPAGREPALALAAAAALIAVLCAPLRAGDLDHRLWQGNGFDAASYMLLSTYVQELPVQWALDPALQPRIVERDPAASTVIPLVNFMRLATMVALAWSACVQGREVYACYLPFKLLNLVIALPVALVAGRRLGLGTAGRVGFAAVVAAGFWAFHAVDNDAVSQTNALPLALLALAGWLQAEQEAPGRLLRRERLLLAAGLAALLSYYGEMLPLLAAAIVCERLLALRGAPRRMPILLGPLAAAVLGAALLAPALPSHLDYLRRVCATAFLRPREGWGEAVYPFLYDHGLSLTGLWGLHFWREAARGNPLLRALVMTFALALTGCVVVAVIRGLRRTASPAERILAACVVGFWGGALVVWRAADTWLAGKGFAYGAPFAAAALFSVAAAAWPLRPLAAALAAAFTITQAATAVWRFPATRPGGPALARYASLRTEGIEEVRRVGALGLPDLAYDFTGEPEPLRRAWSIVLSRQPGLLPLPGLPRYHTGPPLWFRESDRLPTRVLLPANGDYLAPLGLRPERSSGRLVLYRVTPADLDRALAAGPSLRRDTAASVVPHGFVCENAGEGAHLPCAMERGGAGLRFLASGRSTVRLRLSIVPSYSGIWRVEANGVALLVAPVEVGVAREVTLALRPRAGTNWIRFRQPARVLMIALEVVSVG